MWRLKELKYTPFWCWLLGHRWRAVGHWLDIECSRCGAWEEPRPKWVSPNRTKATEGG